MKCLFTLLLFLMTFHTFAQPLLNEGRVEFTNNGKALFAVSFKRDPFSLDLEYRNPSESGEIPDKLSGGISVGPLYIGSISLYGLYSTMNSLTPPSYDRWHEEPEVAKDKKIRLSTRSGFAFHHPQILGGAIFSQKQRTSFALWRKIAILSSLDISFVNAFTLLPPPELSGWIWETRPVNGGTVFYFGNYMSWKMDWFYAASSLFLSYGKNYRESFSGGFLTEINTQPFTFSFSFYAFSPYTISIKGERPKTANEVKAKMGIRFSPLFAIEFKGEREKHYLTRESRSSMVFTAEGEDRNQFAWLLKGEIEKEKEWRGSGEGGGAVKGKTISTRFTVGFDVKNSLQKFPDWQTEGVIAWRFGLLLLEATAIHYWNHKRREEKEYAELYYRAKVKAAVRKDKWEFFWSVASDKILYYPHSREESQIPLTFTFGIGWKSDAYSESPLLEELKGEEETPME